MVGKLPILNHPCPGSVGLEGCNRFGKCKAAVYFPGPNALTPAAICTMIMSMQPGFKHVRAACLMLSALAKGEIQPVMSEVSSERQKFLIRALADNL